MKTTYNKPLCETVKVHTESIMQTTSRESQAGTSPSNDIYDHYNDPTSPIDMIDGGESLSKGYFAWEDMDEWK